MRLKDLYRKIGSVLIPPLGAVLMRLFYLTYKKEFHIQGQLPKTNAVFIGWHGELFINPVAYKKYRKGFNSYAVISHHFDGELIAKTFYYACKIKALRGSSRKGAKAVLVKAIRAVQKGDDVILTPDGPRGPRHKFQAGALSIAKRAGGKVVIITAKPHNFWQLKSWDRFMIPKPFSKVDIYMQTVSLSGYDEKEAAKIEKRMLEHAV